RTFGSQGTASPTNQRSRQRARRNAARSHCGTPALLISTAVLPEGEGVAAQPYALGLVKRSAPSLLSNWERVNQLQRVAESNALGLVERRARLSLSPR